MALHTWLIYLVAAIGLSLTPGPNSLLVLTHGALYGPRRTFATILAGSAGFVLLIALSMLGIGAVLKTSAQALTVLKWGGGAYLVWLGVQLWRSPALRLQPVQRQQHLPARTMARQGFLAALSNPKALLFYGAFLPQFIDPARELWPQFLVMAGTFALIEILVEWGLAALAGRIRPWLERSGQGFNRSCGVLFAAMGAALPLTH